MPGYRLEYLWEVLLADGTKICQTPDNVSTVHPEILILPLVGDEPLAKVHPNDAPPGLLKAVAEDQPHVLWDGKLCHWHRPTQWYDVELASKISPVVEARLFSVTNPNLFAGIWLNRQPHVSLQYGDIYLVYEESRHPAIIPFSLPPQAWPVNDAGEHYRPDLSLICARDVTQDFHDQLSAGIIRDVEYKLGWKTRVDEQEYQYTIKLRAPVRSK